MRNARFLFAPCLAFSLSFHAYAQSFTVAHDTVYVASGISNVVVNDINNLTAGSINISWKIITSTFPVTWMPGSIICDNTLCYTAPTLWPSGSAHTCTNAPGLNDYDVTLDLSTTSATAGQYVTILMRNVAIPTDSATETYIIASSTAVRSVTEATGVNEVILYPNPANSELNVVYDAKADVKNVAVYNIIGKVMTVYKVTSNNGANLDIGNMPAGIYFVRLFNNAGAMIATKKFTKQ